MIAIPSNKRITPAERRLSEQLRPRFLGALGRSGKTTQEAAVETNTPKSALCNFASDGTLPMEALDAVEKWISLQRTDVALARAKRTPHVHKSLKET
jgi:hypothetical protein